MTEQKKGLARRTRRLLVPVVAMGTMAGGALAITAVPATATGVTIGKACAAYTNISLFGGAYGSEGCGTQTSPYATSNSAAPSTTWVSGVPTSVTDSDGMKATYGPADFISSPFDVNDNTQNTGLTKVTSSGTNATSVSMVAKAVGVGPSPFYTATPSAYPISATPAGSVQASCSASSPTSKSGSVNFQSAYIDTKLDANGYPVTTVPVATSPAANTRVDFTIDNVGDYGHIILNERINNADGSLTVNAMHMYAEGPTALGDVILASVTCGHA